MKLIFYSFQIYWIMPANTNMVESPPVDTTEYPALQNDGQIQKVMDQRVIDFANKTGYPIVQENGQR